MNEIQINPESLEETIYAIQKSLQRLKYYTKDLSQTETVSQGNQQEISAAKPSEAPDTIHKVDQILKDLRKIQAASMQLDVQLEQDVDSAEQSFQMTPME